MCCSLPSWRRVVRELSPVEGRAGEPSARGGVCEPPETQRPPFSTALVSGVSVGAYCSPSVNAHGGDPPSAARCKRGHVLAGSVAGAGGAHVTWAVGLKQGLRGQRRKNQAFGFGVAVFVCSVPLFFSNQREKS